MATGDAPEGIESKALALAAGLPAPVAAGGLKAISRLIGGLADYPAAWLRRASQGVEDGTTGRSAVRNALAAAAAERAISDPELVDRALDGFLGRELRKQRNREGVAEQAVEALQEAAADGVEADGGQEPDEDWMNVFERYAEDASSERMQILWGRLLSGEIRKPRSYSLATMRFLSEADQEAVTTVKRASEYVVGGVMFRDLGNSFEASIDDILAIKSMGLLSGGDGMAGLEIKLKAAPDRPGHLVGQTHALAIEASAEHEFRLGVYKVTRLGREIFSLTPSTREEELLRIVANKLGSAPATCIHVGRMIADDRMQYPSPAWTPTPKD